MAKRKRRDMSSPTTRPRRAKLTAEESFERMEEFPERKEQFIGAVRKGKDRSVPA
jgi:hypothetical protein